MGGPAPEKNVTDSWSATRHLARLYSLARLLWSATAGHSQSRRGMITTCGTLERKLYNSMLVLVYIFYTGGIVLMKRTIIIYAGVLLYIMFYIGIILLDETHNVRWSWCISLYTVIILDRTKKYAGII